MDNKFKEQSEETFVDCGKNVELVIMGDDQGLYGSKGTWNEYDYIRENNKFWQDGIEKDFYGTWTDAESYWANWIDSLYKFSII